MDGASKFVRGDAIAGILITVVNIFGGLLIGVLQRNLDLAVAAKNYTMLSIGDGILAQIPALIISTAAGTVVTRSSRSGDNMGTEMAKQLLLNPRALGMTGAVLALLALIPGLPTIPFILIGGFMGGLAWLVDRYQVEGVDNKRKADAEIARAPAKENIENLLPLDLIELGLADCLNRLPQNRVFFQN